MKKYVSNRFTANTSKPIVERLNGRDYYVGNVSMMTEGVHAGSLGPLYYSKNELSKWATCWNHKPIVIRHPVTNAGTPTSASSKEVMETQYIGFLMNSGYSTKQKSQFWIDKELVTNHNPTLAEKIANGEAIEVSTGLEIDLKTTNGKWNDEDYTGEAVNHRPDHLAVLPDEVGACSLADGAGLCVNEEIVKQVGLVVNSLPKVFNKTIGVHVTNVELSFDEIGSQINDALRTRFGKPGYTWWGYIQQIYSDYIIFNDGDDFQSYMLKYSVDEKNGVVTLDANDPVPVIRVISYTVANSKEQYTVTNDGKSLTLLRGTEMSKKAELIAKLVSNGKYSDADKKALETLSEEALSSMVGNSAPAPVVEKPVIKDMDSLMTVASPELREALVEIVANAQVEKERLIEVIVKNTKVSKEALSAMKVPDLRNLAAPFTVAERNGLSMSELVANRVLQIKNGSFEGQAGAFVGNAYYDETRHNQVTNANHPPSLEKEFIANGGYKKETAGK